mmetsp:Transcript_18440/g.54725  ORF Transcript_18440/g.54725 Transcript_18440/m.54725 type:complete len:245 (+) Transcript_18440:2-736(+)
MAGGQGGAKKLKRSTKAVAAGEAPSKRASGKSAAKAKPASEEPPPAERIDMVVDAKTAASITQRIKKRAASADKGGPSGSGTVLYLGHIPHGFYEEQMRGFFSQFGDVTRLRLARNKKTGASKHYAFVEFAHAEVASIVAQAMNGYLMFTKILVCQVVPDEQLHPNMFKGSGKPFTPVNRLKRERVAHNKKRTADEATALEKKLLAGERKKRRKLEAAGIDYEFGGYEAAVAQREKKRKRAASA